MAMKKQDVEILQKALQELEEQNEETVESNEDEEEFDEEEEEEPEEEAASEEEEGEESPKVKKVRGWVSDADWYYKPENNVANINAAEQNFAEKTVAFFRARRELIKAREELQEIYDNVGYSFDVAKAVVDANSEEY